MFYTMYSKYDDVDVEKLGLIKITFFCLLFRPTRKIGYQYPPQVGIVHLPHARSF